MNLPKNAEPNFGITDIELSDRHWRVYELLGCTTIFDISFRRPDPAGSCRGTSSASGTRCCGISPIATGRSTTAMRQAGASGENSEGSGAYPGGLLANFIFNVCKQPELLAVLNFVDENVGGPEWARSAMRVTGDHLLDAGQLARLANWNGDFEHLIRQGW